MKLDKSNSIRLKLIYTITWSAGLLWATFPEVMSGSYNFELSTLDATTLRNEYTFPLLTVLMLYLWDVVYESAKEEAETGKVNGMVYLLIAIVAFMFFYLLSISVPSSFIAGACFFLAWIAMTAMKFIKTSRITISPTSVPTATSILEN